MDLSFKGGASPFWVFGKKSIHLQRCSKRYLHYLPYKDRVFHTVTGVNIYLVVVVS